MRKRVLAAICLGSLFVGLLGLVEESHTCVHAILILLGLSLVPASFKTISKYLSR